MDTKDFEKSKIFEKLDYDREPENYKSVIPWIVQQQIGATNGIHYASLIGQLKEYPIPEMPLPPAKGENQLLLDLGCGWGRWLVASGKKNYIPIGLDIRLEFLQTAQKVMSDNNTKGYTVAADLQELPFKTNTMDMVWSFSVIQHTHLTRLESCIKEIHRVLHTGGHSKLEFPNKNGFRNRFGPVISVESEKDEYNSWCVRYYSVAEYEQFFRKQFDNFSFQNHSFLGIGVLKDDLNHIRNKKTRWQLKLSLLLSRLTDLIRPLKYLSDSIYIDVRKNSGSIDQSSLNDFLKNHSEKQDNLNIVPLLCCPISKGNLTLSQDANYLVSATAGRKYPIINKIPLLISSQSEPL